MSLVSSSLDGVSGMKRQRTDLFCRFLLAPPCHTHTRTGTLTDSWLAAIPVSPRARSSAHLRLFWDGLARDVRAADAGSAFRVHLFLPRTGSLISRNKQESKNTIIMLVCILLINLYLLYIYYCCLWLAKTVSKPSVWLNGNTSEGEGKNTPDAQCRAHGCCSRTPFPIWATIFVQRVAG